MTQKNRPGTRNASTVWPARGLMLAQLLDNRPRWRTAVESNLTRYAAHVLRPPSRGAGLPD